MASAKLSTAPGSDAPYVELPLTKKELDFLCAYLGKSSLVQVKHARHPIDTIYAALRGIQLWRNKNV